MSVRVDLNGTRTVDVDHGFDHHFVGELRCGVHWRVGGVERRDVGIVLRSGERGRRSRRGEAIDVVN